jgi:hypothetical protein
MPATMMHRASIAALFSVLFSVPFLAGCGHSAAPVPPAVTLSFCGGDPQPAPTVVEVICNVR